MADAGKGPALEWFSIPVPELLEWVGLEAERQKKMKRG